MADTIVLNKIDLAEESTDELIKSVKEINPFAKIIPTTYANISFEKASIPFKFYPEGEQEVGRPELESVVIKTSKTISETNLKLFISEIENSFLRCKGFINLKDKRKVFVQGVLDQYELKEVESFDAPTEFVGIGEFDQPDYYLNLFKKYCLND